MPRGRRSGRGGSQRGSEGRRGPWSPGRGGLVRPIRSHRRSGDGRALRPRLGTTVFPMRKGRNPFVSRPAPRTKLPQRQAIVKPRRRNSTRRGRRTLQERRGGEVAEGGDARREEDRLPIDGGPGERRARGRRVLERARPVREE